VRRKEVRRLWKELAIALERVRNPQPSQVPDDIYKNAVMALMLSGKLPKDEKRREAVIKAFKDAVDSRKGLIERYYMLESMCSDTGHAINVVDELIEKLMEDVYALREAYGSGYVRLKTVKGKNKKRYVYPVYTTLPDRKDIYLSKGVLRKIKDVRMLKRLRRALLRKNIEVCREADHMREAIRINLGPII